MPSEYEIASSKLLYYPEKGFSVHVPLCSWYQRYQRESPLRCSDWDQFRDPRETTYSEYTRIQRDREAHLDGLLCSAPSCDRRLTPSWLEVISRLVTPLRFVFHGFQMLIAYIGQLAPSGRIAIAALLQAADEIRRIERIAYRIAQLRVADPAFGQGSKQCWETNSPWQPIRRAVERLLITYDWGEALIGLNVWLKPLLDEIFMVQFADQAEQNHDSVLGKMFLSFNEDCQWQREWTSALLAMALADCPENRRLVGAWLEPRESETVEILSSLIPLFGPDSKQLLDQASLRHRAWLDQILSETQV